MFAYCRNNPVCRIDISGTVDAVAADIDEDVLDNQEILGMDGGGGSSSWDIFVQCLDCASSGLSIAVGERRSYPNPEQHHVVPYNNKKHTPKYEGIIEKYNFPLDSKENIIPLENHRGRHTEGYHYFITVALYALDDYAQGNKDAFNMGFRHLADYVSRNPWLPYAQK